MTILIYDYRELEERAGRHLKIWKGWHIALCVLAAVFGLLNYIFLQKTMEMIDDQCVLYPRKLDFKMAPVYVTGLTGHIGNNTEDLNEPRGTVASPVNQTNSTSAQEDGLDVNTFNMTVINVTVVINNVTILVGNTTHHMVLDTSRSLFGEEGDCSFAEYMPLMGVILAILWTTFFTMCPGGGRSRTGLPQPWRILSPALLFALLMVILTGHSFTVTNGGVQAFCAAFSNYTNATTCSSADPYLEQSYNTSWGFGGRTSATRAASAGAWASWACATALLLARCLAAPDFTVKRTTAYLKDPKNKLTPYLKKAVQVSTPKKDTVSVRSDPTATTELVSVNVEHENDSMTTSPTMSPIKKDQQHTTTQAEDEM